MRSAWAAPWAWMGGGLLALVFTEVLVSAEGGGGALARRGAEAGCQEPAPAGGSPAQEASEDAQEDPDLEAALALERVFRRVAERARRSLVTITAYERDPEAGPPERDGGAWVVGALGNEYPGYRKIGISSGFALNAEGHVLGCRHGLLKQDGSLADLVSIETQDQRHTFSAILGTEPTLNLAVLQLEVFAEEDPPRFEPAALGDSGAIRPGQWAIGVGDPEGPEKFLAVGTFTSGPSRDCYQEQLTATYLQAAMRAHPEAYGGPLMNVRGEVVGVLTPRDPAQLKAERPAPHTGLEFALPSDIVRGIYRAILQEKSHRSPWIGFAVMSRPELIREKGAEAFSAMDKPGQGGIYVENVFDPSPAQGLGIRPGDWLVRFGSDPVRTPLDFQKLLYLAGVGAEVELGFYRDGEEIVHRVKIEARPENASTR